MLLVSVSGATLTVFVKLFLNDLRLKNHHKVSLLFNELILSVKCKILLSNSYLIVLDIYVHFYIVFGL